MPISKKKSSRAKSIDQSTDFIIAQDLWVKILIGMFLGIIIGFTLSPDGLGLWDEGWLRTTSDWLALPGIIFLGLIQMVIVPLIACSIILGIAESKDLGFVKRISFKLIPYFILTTTFAITIGIGLVSIVQPGSLIDPLVAEQAIDSGAAAERIPGSTFEDLTIPDRIANLVPSNLTKAQVEKNMLQIVIASILLGVALITIPSETARPFKDLCVSGQVICMKIISWAMIIAPIAVFGLIASVTIKLGIEAIMSVGLYTITVITGLLCMLAIYLIFIALFTRTSPVSFLNKIREVQLLAFSTASSGATMPFTIKACEEKLGIRQQISRFVIPIGTTINMDGTAMYQGIAAIFLCQVFGIELSILETVLLILTTVGASIGTPATPRVGLVILSTILVGIGVPAEGVALILGVDALLDMCRTTINVTGDITAAKLMDKWVKDKNDTPR